MDSQIWVMPVRKMLVACYFLAALLTANAAMGRSLADTMPVSVSGYAELYYQYDVARPDNHQRPSFVYAYNRTNEVNVNLALARLSYQSAAVRGNLSLGAGTYMNANYAAEPGVLKNLFEANIGLKVSRNHTLWLDAGVFASHLGFESPVGSDCWNLTRSMAADNSPYYETGVKLGYTSDNERWFLGLLLLNGWQRIQRVDGNNTPAIGHQVTYKPNRKLTLNSSSFVGSDKPDTARQMRIFHDLYAIIEISGKLALTAAWDMGWEQASKGSSSYRFWHTPVLMLRYRLKPSVHIAARAEYFHDPEEVLITQSGNGGFKTVSGSLNADILLYKRLLWRVEAKAYQGQMGTFVRDGQPASKNFVLISSLALSL